MPLCEENVLDIPVNASTIGDNEVVMFTKADGTTVLRLYGTLRAQFVRYVHTCTGSEGSVLPTGLVNIPLNKISNITRSGSGVADIIEVPPAVGSDDVQWDSTTGDLTVATDLPYVTGEKIVIVRLA